MTIHSKTISVVYKNKNTIPVNKQAVKEFYSDHESVVPDFSVKRPDYTVSRAHFKKATAKFRETDDSNAGINFVDYERVCSSIKRTKTDCLPYKYKKLMGHIMHMTNCNRRVAILVIQKMADERFIKVHGEFVEYF